MSFVEMRTYQLKTGTANTYAALYLEEGFAIQKSHLGEPVGYYVSEVGPQSGDPHVALRQFRRASGEKDCAIFGPCMA